MQDRVKMYIEYKRELRKLMGIDEDILVDAAESDVRYCEEAQDARWFAIKEGDREIGFIILARGRNLMRGLRQPKVDYFIQETYIKPEYRRKGIMTKEVQKLLNDWRGVYGLYILNSNKPALAFWHKVIGDRWIEVDDLANDEDGKEYAFDNREEGAR